MLTDWMVLRPQTAMIFAQLMLSLVITGVLAKIKNKSSASRFLMYYFAATTMAYVFNGLADAGVVSALEYVTDPMTLVFFLLATVFLVRFAYHYPAAPEGTDQAERWTLIGYVFLLIIGVVGTAGYSITHQHPYLMLVLLMNVVAHASLVVIMLRRGIACERKAENKTTFGGFLRKAKTRESDTFRSMALLLFVHLLLSLMAGAYWMFFYNQIGYLLYFFALHTGLLLYLVLFILVYLSHAPEPTTAMVKLLLGTLALVLFLTASLGSLYLGYLDDVQDQEWQEKVREIEAGKTLEELPTEVAFVLSYDASQGQLDSERVGVSYPPLSSSKEIQVLMAPSAAFNPHDLKVDDFVSSHYTKAWSYTDDHPEKTYITYTFENDSRVYMVGFYAVSMIREINQLGMPVMTILLFSTLAILAIFPRFFKRSLVEPLNQLLQGVKAVNQGDLTVSVPIVNMDEIGYITNSFNKMVASVSEANQYMKDYNQILHREVAQRTSQLHNERELFRTTLFSMGDAVITTDETGRIKMMNQVAEELTGRTREEAKGLLFDNVVPLYHEETKKEVESPVKQVLERREMVLMEIEPILVKHNGERVIVDQSAAPVLDGEGNIKGVVVVIRDFTEKRSRQEEIRTLSFHDQLTGLHNRRCFEETLARMDEPNNLPLGLLVLDLNGLKLINDAFGHQTGDEALKKISGLLMEECRNKDFVARIGGDEFVIILPNTDLANAEKMAERISGKVKQLKTGLLSLSASVGCAVKEHIDERYEDVFKKAEDEMYRRKLSDSKHMHSETIRELVKTFHQSYPSEMKHAQDVAELSVSIGKTLGMENGILDNLKLTGFLHNIGKLALPSEVLLKTEPLTSEEEKLMQRYPEVGYQMLRFSQEYGVIADDVLAHQEWWNGKGYPRGLHGDEISLNARIVSIAKAWSEMRQASTAGKELDENEIFENIEVNGGVRFDPQLVPIFMKTRKLSK